MVTTAGAETLPFLASCVVLPASLAFFMAYGKMVEALPSVGRQGMVVWCGVCVCMSVWTLLVGGGAARRPVVAGGAGDTPCRLAIQPLPSPSSQEAFPRAPTGPRLTCPADAPTHLHTPAQRSVFYAALAPLVVFYVLFTAVLYPMHGSLHLNGFYAATAPLVPAGLHGLLKGALLSRIGGGGRAWLGQGAGVFGEPTSSPGACCCPTC